MVHVKDVCAAYIAGIEAPTVGGRSYNVGIQNGNFTVRDLAAAQRTVPGSELTFTENMERMLGRTVFLSHGS